ncbi:MAG: hypothetical protein JRJ47_09690, partial [Deltaproteobacteria bacterium]|nr:hypothetical protein [Deltaproteobacteria bacterium]
MRNKDSAGEYSSQQGASPSVSVGNLEAVAKEASTHRRVPVVASVKGKGPAVCKLMLRQATVARKTRNCCLTERSIITILQGVTITPSNHTRPERRSKAQISKTAMQTLGGGAGGGWGALDAGASRGAGQSIARQGTAGSGIWQWGVRLFPP